MYLFKHAYPAAKELLQSRVGYLSGMKRLLVQCRADFSSPLWKELAACDFEGELNQLCTWWPASKGRDFPADDIEVLFIALEDVPYSFELRGSKNWSRDPANWNWWYDNDYFGPTFKSTIMGFALGRSEIHDRETPFLKRRRKHAPANSDEVVEMYFSLGYYGLLVRELIRNFDKARILGNRDDRWLVIGHPDAVYGIILGKLTRTRWLAFQG
jgi:hypothetical protein